MKPRIHVITLAVGDLPRALDFYRDGLGLESAGIIGTEFPGDEQNPADAAAMFQLDGGLILASKEEVDSVLAAAQAAGARLTGPPWGIYSGYFQDLDGHLWEVISQLA
jgi:uncharacterized protein